MEDELIKFETAKLAKEKGCELKLFGIGFEYIDEDGNEYWTSKEKGISGKENTKPVIKCTQSLLQKWLRGEHKIDIYVLGCGDGYYAQLNNVPPSNQGDVMYIDRRWNMPPKYINDTFKTYEEALEKGLQEALKLI